MPRLTSVVLSIAFFALSACADVSCTASAVAETTPCVSGTIQYTNAPANVDPVRIVPVLIDRNFSLNERAKILRAVNEWNVALNGHVHLEISADDASSPAAAVPSRTDTWRVVRVESLTVPMLAQSSMKRALAYTVGTSRGSIFVIVDRLGSRDLGAIMLHEFGHALGAGHDPGGQLMHPFYAGDKQRCIDKAAVRAVGVAQKLPFERLNWCV
jgi:hypothetical protein